MVTKRSDTIDYLSSVQGHSRNDILMAMGGHFSTRFLGKQIFEWLKYIHGVNPHALGAEEIEKPIVEWLVSWVLTLTSRPMSLEEAAISVNLCPVPNFQMIATHAGIQIFFTSSDWKSAPLVHTPFPLSDPRTPRTSRIPWQPSTLSRQFLSLTAPIHEETRPLASTTSPPRPFAGPPMPLFRRGGGYDPQITILPDGKLKCSLCKSEHFKVGTLRRHFKVHTQGEVQCPFDGCKRWYYRADKLRQHLAEVHPQYARGDPTVIEMVRGVVV